MADINPGIIAVVGTIFGGAGLKGVEAIMTRSKAKSDVAAEIRKELRDDVQSLRDEMRKLETELDAWKAKYYDLLDQFYKKGLKPDVLPEPPA